MRGKYLKFIIVPLIFIFLISVTFYVWENESMKSESNKGKILWKIHSPAWYWDIAILPDSQGNLYVYESSLYGNLLKISPQGKVIWKVSPPSGNDDAPVLPLGIDKEDNVYIIPVPLPPAKPKPHYLFSYDPNGTLRWSTKLDDSLAYKRPVCGDKVVCVVSSKYIYSINIQDGKIIWKKPMDEGWLFLEPAFFNDTIYTIWKNNTTNKTYLTALDSISGKIIWKYPVGGRGALKVDRDGTIYLCRGSKLYSFTPDGDLKWKSDVEAGYFAMGYFGIGKENLYTTTTHKLYFNATGYFHLEYFLYAFSKIDGKLVWKTKLWSVNTTQIMDITAPTVGPNENIYVGIGKYLISVSSQGKIRWKIKLNGFVDTPVVGKGGIIYVSAESSDNGRIYAIKDVSNKSENSNLTLYYPLIGGICVATSLAVIYYFKKVRKGERDVKK